MSAAPQKAPGPRGIGMILDLPKLYRMGALSYLEQLWHTHGDVVRLPFGPRQAMLFVRPEHVRHILTSGREKHAKGAIFEPIKPILGNGLVTSEGDFWRRQRRLLQPSFTKQGIQGFADAIAQVTSDTAAQWQSANGAQVNISKDMRKLAMAVICHTMLDMQVDQDQEKLTKAFDFVLTRCAENATRIVRITDVLPLPGNIRFKQSMRMINGLMYDTIDQRKKYGGRDLTAELLQAKDPETGAVMSDRQLRDEIITIFFAGHETTALGLGWAWYLLSQHPEVMQALQEEVDTVLGDRLPTIDDLEKLEYCKAVFQEALRLYPPAWTVPREAIEDDVIDGYKVPKGTITLSCVYLAHRHPENWEDPEAFRPERFVGEAGKAIDRYAYIPFGAGPRTCIGNHFALMEAQIVLAVLARQFTPSYSGPPVEWDATSTLAPKRDIYMTLATR